MVGHYFEMATCGSVEEAGKSRVVQTMEEWIKLALSETLVLKVTVAAKIGIHRSSCPYATDVHYRCFTTTCAPCDIALRSAVMDDTRWAAYMTLLHRSADVPGCSYQPEARLRRKTARQGIFFFNDHDDWVEITHVEVSREIHLGQQSDAGAVSL